MAPDPLVVLGVRHHSPACARLAEHLIRELRPSFVLIEGPADLNDRLDELLLPHDPPVAVFTYYQDGERRHSSWTPFCRHSPEWVALHGARAVGAVARFIDLPAWTEPFANVRNRYADRPDRDRPRGGTATDYVQALCRRLGVDDLDTLWDHLFEQELPLDELAERLTVYFATLRGDTPGDERDGPRESFMARHVAEALAERRPEDGPVLVVCGGYHAPFLARARRDEATARPVPVPRPAEGARHGSFLVPFSFRRLDSFAGYESGMPSPAYQDAVFTHGPGRAGDWLLARAVTRLRERRQAVSPADLIAAATLSSALARMRGHRDLLRTDVLDGLASALVKDGLEAPLPWSVRGSLLPRTDPLLVEIVAALSGEKEGRLADRTPRPPLVGDVERLLTALDLVPAATPRTLSLDLGKEDARERSRVLHRLRVLEVPGFSRDRGPAWATDVDLVETWTLRRVFETESALIEAGSWGPTLETAALARLEERLLQAGVRLTRLAALLGDAVFVGIDGFGTRVLDGVSAGVARETSFGDLATALPPVLALYQHGDLLGAQGSATLGTVLVAGLDRGLWLLEALAGDEPADEKALDGVRALRDLVRLGLRPPSAGALPISPAPAEATMRRRAHDPQAPPAIRGAALGFLWSLALLGPTEDAEAHTIESLRLCRPSTLGDFLAGLFALAREEVARAPSLLAALDRTLSGLGRDDFLGALPALRLAFTFFPPRERDRLARMVLAHHRADAASPRTLLTLPARAEDVARGLALEDRVTHVARRFGLGEPS